MFFYVYLWAAVFYYLPWTAGASARDGRSSQQPGHGRRRPSIPQAPHGAGASREWLVGGDGRSEGHRLGRHEQTFEFLDMIDYLLPIPSEKIVICRCWMTSALSLESKVLSTIFGFPMATSSRGWLELMAQESAPDNDTSNAEASQPSQLVNACHGNLMKFGPLGGHKV